mgnify:FL=1
MIRDYHTIEVEVQDGWSPQEVISALAVLKLAPPGAKLYALYPGTATIPAAIVFRIYEKEEERT